MQRNFLLTYSVKAQTDYQSDKDKAEKVRNKIAALDCWKKSDYVETTFSGEISISGSDDGSRKRSAKSAVESAFLPILEFYTAPKADVIIHCAIMIEGVATAYEFDVKY